MQFTFEQPSNLWFIVALPLLIIAHYVFLRFSKKRALQFANFRALKRITGQNLITRNYLLLGLRLLTLFFLILALAGTVLWYQGKSNANDYVIAIDSSASMSSQDIAPTRLDAAKEDAKLFVDSLDSETRIGVVTFSGVAIIETIPTSDKQGVKEVLDNLEVLKAGGTDIPGAIITSTNLLLDKSKGRSIILLTDGSNTIETFLDASLTRATAYAQENHVRVHAIGLGTNTGPIGYLPTYYNVSATYNEDNLLQIANLTSGIYVKAENAEQLRQAFAEITADTSSQLLRRDLRPLLTLLALCTLFIEWVLINTRYRSIP
jgi:Ca-activated chloride channel homolog